LAEDTGLVRELDERVLALVCERLALWRRDGLPVPPVSVNFSGYHFREPGAVARIARILEDTGALGENLVIEVSEHVTLESSDAVALALNAIKELGIGLCVDDFGAGHSALQNLRRYPIDSLKIDGRLIQGLGRDENSAVIVRGILALARVFGLKVTAEGIEHGEQAALLRAYGCGCGQGYHFSAPFAPGELGEILQRFPGAPE
jgi:EAL domain-containing protein (putative c-di-GMP-specific phosphodiesterase class I)